MTVFPAVPPGAHAKPNRGAKSCKYGEYSGVPFGQKPPHAIFTTACAAKRLFQDRVVLVSQSVIEGEIGAHLKRILHVRHDIRAPIAAEGQRPDEGIVINGRC